MDDGSFARGEFPFITNVRNTHSASQGSKNPETVKARTAGEALQGSRVAKHPIYSLTR